MEISKYINKDKLAMLQTQVLLVAHAQEQVSI